MLYFDLMSTYKEEVSPEIVIPDFCVDDPAPKILGAPAEREPQLRVSWKNIRNSVLDIFRGVAIYGLR